MRQLGELNKNGAKEFKDLGVEVVAVFREEKEGLAGLKKIKGRTKVDFTLALDTPASATAAYSNGRKEFDNYVVDKNGVIRGVLDGSLKSRAQAAKLLEIVKSAESGSAGMAAATPADDQAVILGAVLDYADGVMQAKSDLLERVVHPDLKMIRFEGGAKGQKTEINYSDLGVYAAKNKVFKDINRRAKVLDVSGNLASAKLISARGTEMIQLVKEDGEWKILQILSHSNLE